jgi:hypothetical protein
MRCGCGVFGGGNTAICETDYPVVVRIRDAILVFNVLWLDEHLEPNCHFVFLNVP